MVNKCQYWIEDEPGVCPYWGAETTICTFEGIDSKGIPYKAPAYPYCNLLGTNIACSEYAGTGTKPRCVLPDPFRHVCNRETGQKWVTVTGTTILNADGDITTNAEWDWDAITGYNNGECNGEGTDLYCSGYSPGHMSFGKLKPEPLPADLMAELNKSWTGYKTIKELGYRLPFSYAVWNKRAQLSRCKWWDGEVEEFSIDENMGYVNPINFKCSKGDPYVNQFSSHKFSQNGVYSAPCNGCKPECAYYTGICWEYCIDSKMQDGDKILGEQIIELRYYLKSNKWTYDEYVKSFVDPHIYAWTGPEGLLLKHDENGNLDINNSIITANHLYQTDFDYFNIIKIKEPLTAGTAVQDGKVGYPTLVRELKDIYLTPVIKNKFDIVEDRNIVESTKLDINDPILIFGEMFWYDSQTYGINLNDEELVGLLPKELLQYSDMKSIKDSMSSDVFKEFYASLDVSIRNLILYCSDKMVASSSGGKENMFHINVPTFFGDNTIIVLNDGSGRWEFDKVTFEKRLCGGIIGQTSFSVTGAGGKIDYLPDYAATFGCSNNDNGLIQFKFFQFMPSEENNVVAYVYNDSVLKLLSASPSSPSLTDTYLVAHKKYKCTVYDTVIIDQSGIQFYGNSGYALVTIPDEEKLLSNAISPWEVSEDSLKMRSVDINGNEVTSDFEVVYQDILGLEVNQLIIKPKDLDSFYRPCPAFLLIDKIYNYEKRSFGEEPEVDEKEEERLAIASEDDRIIHVESAEIEGEEGGVYSLTKFDHTTLLISVVYKGITGRIRGVTRTKMITWVKQPYCRDVEIQYSWTASYTKEQLLPWLDCYGPRGFKYFPEPVYHGRTPRCVDHDILSFSKSGPMWYPYNACDPYERYRIISQFTEFDTSIIEQFSLVGGDGKPLHGAFDLRMMGPDNVYAYTGDVHLSIWNCNCDYDVYNDRKKNLGMGSSTNVFSGFGRYRGGLSSEALATCLSDGGILPKFGNVNRDFIRSYRSVDNISYYQLYTSQYLSNRKWVPMYTSFSCADITCGVTALLYDLGTEDYVTPFVDQFGLLLAGSLENIDVNETVDLERYRFTDIFESLSTYVTIAYPSPRKLVVVGGITPKVLTSWYRYKDPPNATTNCSIQWAWQEIWKPIERANMIEFLGDLERMNSELRVPPYDVSGDGKHNFLTIEYPDYVYDARLIEHRLVCDEGEHVVTIIPNVPNDAGNVFFLLILDDGPFRIFNLDGEWDPFVPEDVTFSYEDYGSNKENYKNLYDWCIGGNWVDDVTIFDGTVEVCGSKEQYEDMAEEEDDKRVIESYDELGEKVETYYHRGLNITLNPANFSSLPGMFTMLSSLLYEIKLSASPDLTSTSYDDEMALHTYVSAANYLDLTYDVPLVSTKYVELSFNFKPTDTDAYRKRVISKIKCIFTVGAEADEEIVGDWSGTLFHEPSIELLMSDDDISYVSVYKDASMTLSNKHSSGFSEYTWIHKLAFSKSLFENPAAYIKLRFRITPTDEELEEAELASHFVLCKNKVHIKYVYIYESEFIQGTETIKTYERLYNISTGNHGDFPPQGTDESGSLLYPLSCDLSTVYQRDTENGVVGMGGTNGTVTTASKLRGRIMDECHKDKESLPSGDIYTWEAEQKKIHDNIVNKAPTSFTMVSVCPPGLVDRFHELKIQFPKWSCSFFNDYPMELAAVLPKEPYSPCGHEFHHNWESVDLSTWDMCGRLFARNYVNDRFEYGYRNYCSDTGFDSIDINEYINQTQLGAWYNNPMVFLQSDDIRMAEMDRSDNTTEDVTSFGMPPNVEPFI